jgi:hypothetical protein
MRGKRRARVGRFAICVDNADYPASLEARKLYEVLPDEAAVAQGQLRVVDESGDHYLYPAQYFRLVVLPPSLDRALRRPQGRSTAGRRHGQSPAAIRPA